MSRLGQVSNQLKFYASYLEMTIAKLGQLVMWMITVIDLMVPVLLIFQKTI